jgi:hypothetical protein
MGARRNAIFLAGALMSRLDLPMGSLAPVDTALAALERRCRFALALAIVLPAMAVAQPMLPVESQATTDVGGCGQMLSAPILEKWAGAGAERGPLGCPVARESATVSSRAGTTGREADFKTGAIIWHGSGGRAGQTYIVSGCAFRLYFQFGGAGGWLGLPTSDATNTPDGQRQSFEGGRITFLRATDECDAEPTNGSDASVGISATAPAITTSSLDLFYDPARDDHLTAAAAATVSRALAAHYQRVRGEALVFTNDPGRGAAPLKLFWNEALGDHVTTATGDGEREALRAGYVFEGLQGFVWTDPHNGTTPLQQLRDPRSGHNLLLSNPVTRAEAQARGYVFVRIEGYAPAAP